MLRIRKYGRLIAQLFGIAVSAYVILTLAQTHQKSDWMVAVRNDFPRATDAERQAKSLDALCSMPDSRKAVARICETQDHLTSLRLLAVVTIGATFLLLVAVFWAGQRCKRDPRLLLLLFQTGTRIMTGATLLSVLSQASLFMAMLYFGPMEFFNVVPAKVIFFIGLGALFAVVQVGRLLFAFNKSLSLEVDGRFVSPSQAPDLWSFVRETASRVGTEPPDHIVAGIAPQFFVTEAEVKTPEGEASHRTLYLSIPLCQILSRGELRSVLGHELAHFHGGDTEFSRKFYPAFRNGTETLDAVTGAASAVGWGGYALLPAISLLSFYLESFSEAEAGISRERELAADAIGAAVTSKREIATALMKIIMNDATWEEAYAKVIESSTADKVKMRSPTELFRELSENRFRSADLTEQIGKLESERLPHPTDSHPPLVVRLEALGFSVTELYTSAIEIRPNEPSSMLIPGAEGLERELFPDFAPRSDDTHKVFCRRQAGFATMEYYALILNRSFLVFVAKDGLYGFQFSGMVTSSEAAYFEPALEVLDDPWFTPGTPAFLKTMKEHRANFFLPYRDISDVVFDGTSKWGMGKIPHSGKLRLRLSSGRTRELVLLGDAYGDGIRRVILENRDRV